MDAIQILINKLAAAASGGEDNIALLEIVEEIKGELLANEPIVQPDMETSSVSVMLPQGFKIKSYMPAMRQPAVETSKLSAPRPPSIITESNEVVIPVSEFNIAEPIEEITEHVYIQTNPVPIEEVPAPTSVSLPALDTVESITSIVADIHVPWMPALPIEETLELPITDEMVHEAVALESLAKKPVTVMGPVLNENPIVTEKTAPQELNQKLAQRTKALNEIFTKKEPVLAEVLSEPRIIDLRKAISINEKYQYINSLFRGDEQMFERSIKTLNNFDILPEAQYWMQRELLIKLGWNDEDELVQRFFSLVNRRFS